MRIRILASKEINDDMWARHLHMITEESSNIVVHTIMVAVGDQSSPHLQELYGLYSEAAIVPLLGKPTKNSISA